MALLKREDLIRKQKLEIVKVDLSDGNYVFVKEMTGLEREEFERTIMKQKFDDKGDFKGIESTFDNYRGKLVVKTICDEKGELLLKPEDVKVVMESMGASSLEKIVNAAQKLNAITTQDKDNLLKNSEADKVVSSSSDSAKD